eukprot:gnl/Dysnectes_brevis/2360_a2786_2766.p1 GENE.gnl/Dysnectes_brevis/2360_a2786_2766~~gnl/Dysnectes_brevis/2360_a2786_2766.p1  ORF type:complete len:207 (-),score=20.22 gnl/Dysnectes_brevis/2360_a2786_2766:56-676(-)
MSSSYHLLVKLILIGSSTVGKSCILLRFVDNRFVSLHDLTIGVEFGNRTIVVDDQIVKLQIWDTAGQEQFRSITRSYYRGAAGALLVYDITRRESFENVAGWLKDARQHAPDIVCMLVGNKADLGHRRRVSREEGEQFAAANGLLFAETSAKESMGVDDAFLECARMIVTKVTKGELDPESDVSGVKLGSLIEDQDEDEGQGGCCK